MTSRRALGKGPQIQGHEADLLAALPNVRLPDLGELRARGVLGTQPVSKPAERRALGTGGQTEHHQDNAQA
ncbi:hypothetical protein ACFQ9J_35615 [Streptomyces sp. NPDC056529]|uniref:hypothetical protein n=1 Tax=Streptomyces sp. NPDC056529 TaxID=3345855 RepID=UPI0036B8957F